MSKHAEGYRKRDMHSGIPSEEYTAGYELAFPEGDTPRFLPCGHSAGWREGAVCGVCGAPTEGSTAPLSIGDWDLDTRLAGNPEFLETVRTELTGG